MFGPLLLHGRLPGIAKEGQTLLLSLTNPTCVISLISNEGIIYNDLITDLNDNKNTYDRSMVLVWDNLDVTVAPSCICP
jgi:hypothetical protein